MSIYDRIAKKYGEVGLFLTIALGMVTLTGMIMGLAFLVVEVSLLFGLLPPAALVYVLWSVKNGN